MAELNLNAEVTVEEIKELLDQNLEGMISPHVGHLPQINSKGIYFWFMQSNDGYDNLSQFVPISPINGCYKKTINGVKYDLVYIGTAGTKGQGLASITDRLDWHIYQEHTVSQICNGTISTFRKGLGSLLSNDLIIGDQLTTEEKVNVFMNVYMQIFWIEYGDNVPLINSDEKILISKLKPLFNLDHNPNSYVGAEPNSTRTYKKRRNEIEAASKARHCKKGNGSDEVEAKQKSKLPPKPPVNNKSMQASSNYNSNSKCVSFFVNQGELAADVAEKTAGLPTGIVNIDILDVETGNRIYAKKRGDGPRETGLQVAVFFRNQDTHEKPNKAKQLVLQEEMRQKGVKRVKVVVCPIN